LGESRVSRIIKCVGNVLIALVIVLLLFFVLGPRFIGIDFFNIYSGSMSPALPVGSVVMVRPVEVSHIKVGDIIAFKTSTGSETVVHRVIDVIDGNPSISVRTAGDANNSPDVALVTAGNIVGKVFFHMSFLGYLSDFVRTKLGYVLLVILPSILIISLEIRNIINELRLMKTPMPEGRAE
jgi:signal peptidase I